MNCIRVLSLLLALTGLSWIPDMARAQSGRESPSVDFREQIQPILAGQCFACHGPDEHERQAGLRLDIEEGVRGGVIVVGKSADSELIRRIFSDDPDEIMPPPDSNRQLTTAQRELLKRGVDEGAVWQKHWALQATRDRLEAEQQTTCERLARDHPACDGARSPPVDDSLSGAGLKAIGSGRPESGIGNSGLRLSGGPRRVHAEGHCGHPFCRLIRKGSPVQ